MATHTRTIPIIGASFIAFFFMGSAYVLSGPNPFFTTRVDAKTSEELLKEYAAKDTDGDLLPDWQEALYGTDPENPQSFKEGVTDGDAVAQGLLTPKSLANELPKTQLVADYPAGTGSLTEQFSQRFFAQYLTTRGGTPPTQDQILSFIGPAIQELIAERAKDAAYAMKDVTIAKSTGSVALSTYASQAQRALEDNAVAADKKDLDYFALAVATKDSAALKKLSALSGGYAAVATALMKVPVPIEAALAHLVLANTLMHMSEAMADMAALDTDPIRALVGIGEYRSYSDDLIRSFSAMGTVFAARGVSIAPGVSGYGFLKAGQDSARYESSTP